MHKFFLFLMIAFVLVSCDSTRVFEKNIEIENQTWQTQNRLKFEVDITDTISAYNFLLNLRNTEAYPYSNFYFFFHTYFPDGKIAKDTVQCVLADPTGKWFGSQAGDIIDNQILFKYKTQFPKAGKYYFEVEQGMREEKLPEILDVGLRIEYFTQ